MALDYTLKTQEERLECVRETIAATSQEKLDANYLHVMTDYLLFAADRNQTKKEKKKERSIITKNREATVNKRQISFEEMVENMENGEDGIYALVNNDKNQILDNKDSISEEDLENIPGMREFDSIITSLKRQFLSATGKQRYYLKKQIIETYQQMYLLKQSVKGWPAKSKVSAQLKNMAHMDLSEKIYFDSRGYPVSNGVISLFNPVHISFLLTYYSSIKQECYTDLNCDMHWELLDFENLIEQTFKSKDQTTAMLYDLLIWKIDGESNDEICGMMEKEYGVSHTAQYFSTLWRKKIPKMIAEQAQKNYVMWYYTNVEYGQWKKCGKCGKTKLAHPLFFSKNNSAKDGFYSTCRECRKSKKK